MSNIAGNYAKHAKVWDWSGYDRSAEFEFWTRQAGKYGDKVLSAMAAIGEVGAYMAQRGYDVTALDYTKEMIEEGIKRFGSLPKLLFVQADVCQFDLGVKTFDFAFIGSTDLHHLQTEAEVTKALTSINRHQRLGGGLGLELWYPSGNSRLSPKKTFKPFASSNENIEIWKEGSSEYNTDTMIVNISQEVYIKSSNQEEHFTHAFKLQLYSRETIHELLKACGYSIISEYGSYHMESWSIESDKWIVEAKKVKDF